MMTKSYETKHAMSIEETQAQEPPNKASLIVKRLRSVLPPHEDGIYFVATLLFGFRVPFQSNAMSPCEGRS